MIGGKSEVKMELSISKVVSRPFIDCIKIIAGSIVLTLASQISFIIPYAAVFVTLQMAALFLIGATLGPVNAALSVILYLAEGLIGLPVFALGQSGIATLLGPKGGYYLGFILTAFISGFAKKEHGLVRLAMTFIAANAATYLVGLSWLALFAPANQVLALGFYPYIIADLLKIASVSSLIKGYSVLKN